MKLINIIGATIVLLANIYVSFNHSIELFQLGGFTGELAYMGVVGAETTFLLGVLNMVVSKVKGEKAGLPAYAGFYLGVSLILWSNIHAGSKAGIVGIILGAVTPASLIVAEAIIGRAILHRPPEGCKVEEEEFLPTTGNPHECPENSHEDCLLETALELYQKNGKIPSRRSFMQVANATEWQARKIIEVLKENIAGGKPV